MQKEIIPVILAGGSGTRLWPLSRKNYPKQFLKLIGDTSLFQQTLLRVEPISGVKESVIVTNHSHSFICLEQMEELEIKKTKLLLEPCSRNTAPAIALAAFDILESTDKNPLMLVLPADHLIGDPESFAKTMAAAAKTAASGYFVTFGIVPQFPKTGYGYIQSGKPLDHLSFKVEQFVEKPDEKTAKRFLEKGDYFWNSGMFLFSAKDYLEELEQIAPQIYSACKKAYNSSEQKNAALLIDEKSFEKCPSDSVDYAIMEKTKRAAIIPLDLPWSDLGCWASVAEAGKADEKNNVVQGNVIMKGCESCFINSESKTLIATLGLKDQIIVNTQDAVLVADKAYAQEVKGIVSSLKDTNHELTIHHKKVHFSWGHYEALVNHSNFNITLLTLSPGKFLEVNTPTLMIGIKGISKVIAAEESFDLLKNTPIQVEAGSSITNKGEETSQIIKIDFSPSQSNTRQMHQPKSECFSN